MQLKTLQIQGFKSFPDKIRLDFSKGITAVVGPNGSGKSNISDAVRWVLGEQSTKTLRGSKMEDVIFVGTEGRKPTGFACVELTIDNTDRRLAMDCDEVTISRKLYRSGDSEYRINQTAVRLKDINELLMDTGLGRDGYCIIGQGRIAEIVDAKTTQRRELFEEAAGISKYRYRKEEAEKQLDASLENLLRLKDILSELEGRMEPLKIQAEKAEQFLELAGEKKVLEISLWIDKIKEYKEKLTAQEERLLICRKEQEDQQLLLEDAERNIEEVYKKIQGLSVEVSSIREEISDNESYLAGQDSQIAVLDNDLRHNQNTINSLETDISRQQQDSAQLEEEIDQKSKEIAEKQQQVNSLTAYTQELERQQIVIAEQLNTLYQKKSDLSDKKAAFERNLSEHRLKQAASASLLEETKKRLETADTYTEQQEKQIIRLQEEAERCRQLASTVDEHIIGWNNAVKGYEMKLASRNKDLEELSSRKNMLVQEAASFMQRAKVLQDMERNLEGFQSSVKFIMNKAKTGEMVGIHGPVSKLITTQEQYATAIEIALGAALQNIVVQDEYSAKKAIEYLKQNGQGRATFLPLTSIRGRALEETGLQEEDGYIGIASRLVQYDRAYMSIVENLLGRTAVVQDMDCGISIARKYQHRFRIVTLDGQIIHAGGSMTGGSVSKKAGILSRQGEIRQLEKKAAEASEKAEIFNKEIEEVKHQADKIAAEITALQAQIKTGTEDKITADAELSRCLYTLEEAKRSRQNSQREYEELKERLHQLSSQSGSSETVIRQAEEELRELEQSEKEMDRQLEQLRQQQHEENSRVSDSRLKQLDCARDQEVLEQAKQHLLSIKESHGKQEAQLLERIEALRKDNEKILQNIEQAKQNKAATVQKNEALRQHIAAAAARREELEKKATDLRSKEKELAVKKERASVEVNRLEERHFSLQKDYDEMISGLWDEYNLTKTQAAEIAHPVPDRNAGQQRLLELKGKIKGLGSVNVAAIEEYKEVGSRYRFMKTQVEDIEHSRSELLRLIKELTGQMQELFVTNFHRINKEFGKIFAELFGGGTAGIHLLDEEDVLQSGIEITVQPPGKIIKNLNMLSGGEKAFVAIAIYFSILKVNPSPFVLLDEIEAALDDVNVGKYAAYLRRLCNDTQFIAITHRRGTMEEADILYGVTMQEEGVTKLLKLDVGEMESKLGMKAD